MPNIKPISDLRNYTSVLKEVKYGERAWIEQKPVRIVKDGLTQMRQNAYWG